MTCRPRRAERVGFSCCGNGGLRRKTIAGMRSSWRDFLAFWPPRAAHRRPGRPQLPPHRHLRHESEPHLWTAEEIRRLLAVIGPASPPPANATTR